MKNLIQIFQFGAAFLLAAVSPALALNQQGTDSAPAYLANASGSPALAEINKLLDAKVDAEVIKAYIQNSPVAYHLTAAEIIALKDRGAPSDVLKALVEHQPQAPASAAVTHAPAPQAGPATSAYPTTTAPMTDPGSTYAGDGYGYSYPYSYPYYYSSYYPGYAYYGFGWPYYWGGYYGCGYYGSYCYPRYGYYHGYGYPYGYNHGLHAVGTSHGFVATRSPGTVTVHSGGMHGSAGFHASSSASFHGGGGGGMHASGGGGGFHGGGGGGHSGGHR